MTIQTTALQLLFSTDILSHNPEGTILKKLLFRDFAALVEDRGIENVLNLIQENMPELTNKLNSIRELGK